MNIRHSVFLALDGIKFELGLQDVVFVAYRGKRGSNKLGELRVSRGAIEWIRGGGRLRKKLRWAKFDELIGSHGSVTRRPLLGDRHNVPKARRRRRRAR